MKNIINLLVCILLLICCTNNNEDINNTRLSVIKSNLTFDALGGNGYVSVESNSIVTVSSNSNWCEAYVKHDNLIEVKVGKNIGREGRTAMMLISNESGEAIHIPVVQKGNSLTFCRSVFVKNSQTIESLYYGKHDNSDIILQCDREWMNVNLEEDDLLISVKKNDTKRIRIGHVIIKEDSFTDTITVTQGEISDLLGLYEVNGTKLLSNTQNVDKPFVGELMKNGNRYVLQIKEFGWDVGDFNVQIPLLFHENNLSFSLIAGSYCGVVAHTGSKYAIFTALCNYSPPYPQTLSVSVSMTLQFREDEGGTIGEICDNGSFPQGSADAILFSAYLPSTSTDLTEASSYNGTWGVIKNPRLKKID